MDGTGKTGRSQPETAQASLDLDALAVSDRFRLFNFTRRDDHLAYLWVLRALERLRAVHHVQAHTEDVAQALAELAGLHEDVPEFDDLAALRGRLDALADDQILHRLEDAARAGSLAKYRNRQSVYQFSELGYRAYTAVEDVLRARVRDANLSRLVFSDILEDLRALHAATRDADADQVYRRLSRLDTVLDDMAIPAGIIRAGFRVVYEPAASAIEQGSRSAREEFARKIRIIAGAVQFLTRRRACRQCLWTPPAPGELPSSGGRKMCRHPHSPACTCSRNFRWQSYASSSTGRRFSTPGA